jgi:hypothetical protein
MNESEGAVLERWMTENKKNPAQVAKSIGSYPSSISYWIDTGRIGEKYRDKLIDLGVPLKPRPKTTGHEGELLRTALHAQRDSINEIAEKMGMIGQQVTNLYTRQRLPAAFIRKLETVGIFLFNDKNNPPQQTLLEPSAEYASVNRKRVRIVHAQAYAGYLQGYNDMNYLNSLPEHEIVVDEDGDFITFEVKGDSMEPDFPDGCYVDCKELEPTLWRNLIRGRVFMFLHPDHGLQIKVLLKQVGQIATFRPINPMYNDFDVDLEKVTKLWYFHQKHDTTRDYSRYLVR